MSDRHLHDDSPHQDWRGGPTARQTAQDASGDDIGSRMSREAYERLERAMGQPWRPGQEELELVYLAVKEEGARFGLGFELTVRLAEAVRTRLKDGR